MTADRSTWTTAYKFHKEALEKLGRMEEIPFWEWMAARMVEIANANGNGALIMALLIAVFEDVEAAYKERRNDTNTKKGIWSYEQIRMGQL